MLEIKKVHEDARGEIYSIPLEENKDLAILVTKKGYARGGHSHPDCNEIFVVVKGLVKYVVNDRGKIIGEGARGMVLMNEPHLFTSLEDSIVLHWGADDKKTVKHEEYRKLVEAINKEMKK